MSRHDAQVRVKRATLAWHAIPIILDSLSRASINPVYCSLAIGLFNVYTGSSDKYRRRDHTPIPLLRVVIDAPGL